MTSTQSITPADIQYLLKKRGLTQRALAKKYGKSEMTISDIIRFQRTSLDLMEKIASEIGMDMETVFAERFRRVGTY
ncbi:hypothetical protein DSCO28_50820 [Desulfosarcina ovata subsp. sediminis]|uniref:HTH cro/C1-type domain-containing protein n=1 Tax=Desulfosarcina ovata subsp. sediminis TaxID=885957 RepID=A0A5K7ZWG1_9BACT|nr:helix-turn-helix domain-containing protein [Desulfosarcina ovata]BBO84516.1 hypothetical protein DSCO28_50820 [Desulfosarcina ovata subsp. sediminis]